MKSLLRRTFLAFISAMLLSGCQSGGTPESIVIDDVPHDRRIGIISSLGGVATSQGTHILKLEGGETILLKSVSINLDDEKYRDAPVEVRGVLTYTKSDKPLMEVVNIDLLENYVMEETKAPEWKTYNGALFTVRYRDDFVVKKDSQGVTFTKVIEPEEEAAMEDAEADDTEQMKDVVSITLAPKEEGQNLLSFLNLDNDESADLLSRGFARSKVGPENLDALKHTEGSDITFYVEGDAYFYTISFVPSEHQDALKHENLFFEMLATFQLSDGSFAVEDEDTENDLMGSRTLDLDFEEAPDSFSEEMAELEGQPSDDEPAAPVEGYSLFENETFGFAMQYPKSWYYEGSSEPGVLRHYAFGAAPLEEEAGSITLDLVSSAAAAGEAVTYAGKHLTKIQSGGAVEFYYEGESRVYKVSGPAGQESVLLQMAASISEN